MKKKRRRLQSDAFWGLLAALLVLLQFWWLPGEAGSAADSYSTTVDGKLGLFRTLSQLFTRVERDALRVVPGSEDTLLLIAPERYPTEKEQNEIYQFVYDGGKLLFAPHWNHPDANLPLLGIRMSARPGPVPALPVPAPAATPSPATSSAPSTSPSEQNATETAASAGSMAETSSQESSAPDAARTVSEESGSEGVGTEVQAVTDLTDGDVTFRTNAELETSGYYAKDILIESVSGTGEAAVWNLGRGRVLVCSSPDVFSNRNMLYRESRRLAVRLVERCAEGSAADDDGSSGAIVISEYFNASDAYQSTGVLFSPALRIGTLQLLLVAILGIWMAFHRFGPAADKTTQRRRSLAESAEAVGNLQYRLSDGGAIVRSYLDYLRSQLRRRYGSVVRLDTPDAIAVRAGMDAEEVRRQCQAAQVMAESSHLSAAQAAGMVRWLTRLQQRLGGSHSVS